MTKYHARRERIVAGATVRFLSHGFSRVTMDRLAADLGVSKKTLYQHFGSKEQLLYAVVTRFLEETAASVESIISPKRSSVLEKLASLMDFMTRRLSIVSLAFLEELEKYAPDMWREVQEFRRRRIIENFHRLYRLGQRQGIFSSEPDPQLTTQLFLSLVQGTMNPQSLAKIPFLPAQVMRAIITIFLFGTLEEKYRHTSRKKFIKGQP
jgi:AcrR family transcriptional regulator